MILRRRFAGLIERQLDLFADDNADLLAQCAAAERAYDEAPRDEAEERYGDYLDLVETGTEILASMRDHYTRESLDVEVSAEYLRAFNRAAVKRFPRFALELEDT
ncbi:MAG: hypothetical protein M3540_00790 [Actinomycetota bacterium]|nr:hypothetical protein [Actinomycetota bacterium]